MSYSAPHFPEPLEDSCRVTSDRIVGAGLSVGQSWRVHAHQTKLNRTILRVGGWGGRGLGAGTIMLYSCSHNDKAWK